MAETRRELLAGARGDGAILRRLLVLQLETTLAYDAALRHGVDGRAARLARALRSQEREHVEGLRNALMEYGGARGIRAAEPRVGRDFAAGAARLEARNVRAGYDAVGAIRNVRLLPGVGAIMASDAQHLALWRELLGRNPVPEAFETGARVD